MLLDGTVIATTSASVREIYNLDIEELIKNDLWSEANLPRQRNKVTKRQKSSFAKEGEKYILNEYDGGKETICVTERPTCRNVILELEEFLSGRKAKKYSRKELDRVTTEYGLRRGRMYLGSKKEVFKVLCQKYENARLYYSYDDLYYVMMDGRREWELSWSSNRKEASRAQLAPFFML